jgi:hypothetical protein
MGAKQDPAEDYVTILFKPVAFLQFGSAALGICSGDNKFKYCQVALPVNARVWSV